MKTLNDLTHNDMVDVLEWMDPDWKDHFHEPEQGFCEYLKYSRNEVIEAIKEMGL